VEPIPQTIEAVEEYGPFGYDDATGGGALAVPSGGRVAP
jgi:hypothetical protein